MTPPPVAARLTESPRAKSGAAVDHQPRGSAWETVATPSADCTPAAAGDGTSPYDFSFWLCYVSNGVMTAAASLLYRYADFVTSLGGDEFELGWIVGIGMIGSLLMRWQLGAGIDRLGARRVWLAAQSLFVAVVAAHVLIDSVHNPAIYALRILYCIAIAGIFGSSITYVSRTVSIVRMAEVVGVLGTSGFLGMALGPVLGDLLLAGSANDRTALDAMFYVAAGLGLFALVTAAWGTRHEIAPRAIARRPPIVALVRRYHPGALLTVGVAIGFGLTLPGTFLRTYTAQLGIGQMQVFFLVYTAVAFVARIATRTLAARFGVRCMILVGMSFLVVGIASYLVVDRPWLLAVPAVLGGLAHAMLFPALMAAGGMSFPDRYRGLATMLMLASMDVGTLVGSPLVGITLKAAKSLALPAYPAMFLFVAALLTVAAVVYARERAAAE
jgi:MFS family permease